MSTAQTPRKQASRRHSVPIYRAAPFTAWRTNLWFERLEERLLLSAGDTLGNAIPISFHEVLGAAQVAQVENRLESLADARFYQLTLDADDVVSVAVDTSRFGGGLDSYLRIYRDIGGGLVQEIARNDNFRGRDPALTFQASTPGVGVYFLQISHSANATYTGTPQSLFVVSLQKTSAPAAANVVAASFHVSQSRGEAGEQVTVAYSVQNRGSAASAPTSVTLVSADENRFATAVAMLPSVAIPALAPGEAIDGSFEVSLPGGAPRQFFLGLQIGDALPRSPAAGNDWAAMQLVSSALAPEDSSNSVLATASPLESNSRTNLVRLPSADRDFFQITLTERGNLSAWLESDGGAVSLALFDADGRPIVRSDGQISGGGPALRHTLVGDAVGTIYYLQVINHGNSDRHYRLMTQFTPTDSSLNTIPLGTESGAVVNGDFNGDGIDDLATANLNYPGYVGPANSITVLLGNGDGTFRKAGMFPVGIPPHTLVTADFDGDGILDLATNSPSTDGVRILRGNGDGTFQNFIALPGYGRGALVAGDFDGDGRADLFVGYAYPDEIGVLRSVGGGAFETFAVIPSGGAISALAVGDFNGDGRLDLAAAEVSRNQIGVFFLGADGTFSAGVATPVAQPTSLVAGDWNGDGQLDLAAASSPTGTVTVLINDGTGGLLVNQVRSVGAFPSDLISADFNRDGRLDLATADLQSNQFSLLLGLGDGTFAPAPPSGVDANPASLSAGDFDGDGNVDVAVVNAFAMNATILLGNGAGRFAQVQMQSTTGQDPVALVRGDFNGDGRDDLATADQTANSVSILIGQGDGTYNLAGQFSTEAGPESLVAGDFNGDGRLDLATANYRSKSISVFLGNGNGTMQDAVHYAVPGIPSELVAGDFDGDFDLDLAISLFFDSSYGPGQEVVLLRNNGQGEFTPGASVPVGLMPKALEAGDFNGDGNLDLAVANYYSGDVTVLLNDGRGGFNEGVHYAIGEAAVGFQVGDFTGARHLDLAVLLYSGKIRLLVNDGNGVFSDGALVDIGLTIKTLVPGDFNGDGNLDLATANESYYGPTYGILLGNGEGDFQHASTIPAGALALGLAVGDFNGDGRLDLSATQLGASRVTTLIGDGAGGFVSPTWGPSPVQSTPILARFLGSSVDDSVVLSETGRILFRRGLVESPGAFAPPVVLNLDPNAAARDLTLVPLAGGGFALAALNARTFAVTLYRLHADGTFDILPGPLLPDGFLPASISAADLTGDGKVDLVVTAAATDRLFVALQNADGSFAPALSYQVGGNPVEVTVADVNVDGALDLLTANRFSGQISVLLNAGDGTFAPEDRYRAGTGLYELASFTQGLAVRSSEGTRAAVAGDFDAEQGIDLVVLNRDALTFTLLSGSGTGGFLNPTQSQTYSLASAPTAIVAGFLDGDSHLDLAVLSADARTVSIFRGDGLGGFTLVFTIGAGNAPTGLTLADISRPGGGGPDGILDLAVGNAFGDVLFLPGKGDGTFLPYRRAEQRVSLVVDSTSRAGRNSFYFSNEASDQLSYQSADISERRIDSASVYQERAQGIEAPGPQTLVNLQGVTYLVVLNSGSNELLVYSLDDQGIPVAESQQRYFTGTDPSALAVTNLTNDLNGDQIPDLVVANQGSNDISVFLGKMVGSTWTLTYRPRQGTAGVGPSSVVITDVTGANGVGPADGIPDVLVANAQTSQVSVLPNRGGGFFINQPSSVAPALFTGATPSLLFAADFDGNGAVDLITVNSNSNSVTLIRNFATDPVTTTIDTGGIFPVAAVVRDFNHDGAPDLLVANRNSETMTLLAGSALGLEFLESFTTPANVQVSDLAVVQADGRFDVYGSVSGQEVAVLLASFGPDAPPVAALPPSPGFPFGLELTAMPPSAEPGAVLVVAEAQKTEKLVDEEGEEIDPSIDEAAVASGTYGSTAAPGAETAVDEARGRSLLPNLRPPIEPETAPPPPPNNCEPREDSSRDGNAPLIPRSEQFVAAPADDAAFPAISLREGSGSTASVVGSRSFERMEISMPQAAPVDSPPAEETHTQVSWARVLGSLAAFGAWFALPALVSRVQDRVDRLQAALKTKKSRPHETDG